MRTIDKKLFDAVSIGDIDTVKFLLASGVNVNVTDTDGCTPLHRAALNDNIDMVNFLLANGANPNAKTNNEETAIYWASKDEIREVLKKAMEEKK